MDNWTEIKPPEAGELSPTWDFKNDKILIGVYLGVRKDVGKHHSNVYTLQLPDGSNVAVWGSTVLDARMNDLTEGEEIKIEYLGDKPTDKGNPYHDFSVFRRSGV